MNIISFLKKLKSQYYYNIGFVEGTAENFIKEKGFGNRKVKWLRHNYHDRWFADPFIIEVDENNIIVLAEEKIDNTAGSIVKLKIHRQNMSLINREIILKLDSHLSYPHPIEISNNIYVLPENSQSGCLNLYKVGTDWKLDKVKTLIHRPLNDASIIWSNTHKCYYMLATDSLVNIHNNCFLFKSQTIEGEWLPVSIKPVVNDIRHARPGGSFFCVNGIIYRPAQDCHINYGNSLHIMRIDSIDPWCEIEEFHLRPFSHKYSQGLHTINFHESGLAVIDGNGYQYPFLGKIFGPSLNLISKGIKWLQNK